VNAENLAAFSNIEKYFAFSKHGTSILPKMKVFSYTLLFAAPAASAGDHRDGGFSPVIRDRALHVKIRIPWPR
jgi:hypothetical protein